MSLAWFVQATLVEPPVNLLLAVGAGLLLLRGAARGSVRRRAGWGLATIGFAGLVVLSLPVTGWLLLTALERDLPTEVGETPGAIVILSAEDLRAVPGGIVTPPDIGMMTLERLRAGALLHKRTSLPILVSGGVLRPGDPPIAQAMARVLAAEFATPARWIEDRSATTWENAIFSTALLRADGISAVYVVTQGWHMRRSLLAFRRAGLPATAAPTHLTGPAQLDLGSFVPSTRAWSESRYAMHEWIGLVWYALRDGG